MPITEASRDFSKAQQWAREYVDMGLTPEHAAEMMQGFGAPPRFVAMALRAMARHMGNDLAIENLSDPLAMLRLKNAGYRSETLLAVGMEAKRFTEKLIAGEFHEATKSV